MKYSNDTTDRICDGIKAMKGRVRSCKEAGISYQTFTRWMAEKGEFREAIKKAEIEQLQSMKEFAVSSIVVAMKKHWQAAAWMLERKWPDEYKDRKYLNIEGDMNLDAKILTLVNKKKSK